MFLATVVDGAQAGLLALLENYGAIDEPVMPISRETMVQFVYIAKDNVEPNSITHLVADV